MAGYYTLSHGIIYIYSTLVAWTSVIYVAVATDSGLINGFGTINEY